MSLLSGICSLKLLLDANHEQETEDEILTSKVAVISVTSWHVLHPNGWNEFWHSSHCIALCSIFYDVSYAYFSRCVNLSEVKTSSVAGALLSFDLKAKTKHERNGKHCSKNVVGFIC